MALSLKEDAPPDDGGEAMHFSTPGGGGRPRVWTIFFLHYKKSISIIIFFANLHFLDNYKREKNFSGKQNFGSF